jgi:hypothetical protein
MIRSLSDIVLSFSPQEDYYSMSLLFYTVFREGLEEVKMIESRFTRKFGKHVDKYFGHFLL